MQNFVLVILIFLLVPLGSKAEPWISNRVAQNCASCHAPGRYNKDTMARRCTLSCQACHTNPNGGGLRNAYGKWNQGRWQKSFSWDKWVGDKKRPAPFDEQHYAKKKKKKTATPVLKENKELAYDESEYTREFDTNYKIEAKSEKQFLSTIPKEDPYYHRRTNPVTAGFDMRFMHIDFETQDGASRSFSWLMGTDVGLAYRPIQNVSLVFENRSLKGPGDDSLDESFTSENITRSAYLLVDDLPYNSHIQYGLYRPMFGYLRPDHNSLPARYTDLDQRVVFKGIGIGTAPNVPFLNVSFLDPGPNQDIEQDKGVVASLGGRFVTNGLSLLASYWSTTKTISGSVEKDKEMVSISAGGQVSIFTVNVEFINVTEEFSNGAKNTGAIRWLDVRSQLWREVYLVTSLSLANTAADLSKGDADEIMVGVNGFLLPGLSAEALYVISNNNANGIETSNEGIQLQLQMFY